jgi:ABC-type uncharacterized transport system, permease component
MLTEVRNQFKVTFLSIKYALMRELLNKTTFITHVLFMLLNNASFIIQWVILYSLKDNVGGYTFKQVLLLWGVAAGTYGFAHFFFKRAFSLSNIINEGKLDSFLVQPKNVLISVITTEISTPAIGDIIYGYIMVIIFGFTIQNVLLFTLFLICGGLMMAGFSVIFSSLSFWFDKSDMIADTANSLMVNFATYPDGIFKGVIKILMFTIIPIGIINYIPVQIMTEFNIFSFLIVIITMIIVVALSFLIFYRGLRKYSSGNLMSAKI